MIDLDTWMTNYRTAWESNAESDIRLLFTDDAVYFTEPADPEPWRGIDGIVAGWLGRSDDPGTTTFEWHRLATEADLYLVRGATEYTSPTAEIWDNLWEIRLTEDSDGTTRASYFTEWAVLRK